MKDKTSIWFEPGLSNAEVVRAEESLRFHFPDDLREFLQTALPTTHNFYNWRQIENSSLDEAFAWPLRGLLFDVERNEFWRSEWGERPASLEGALDVARSQIAKEPKLIPLCGHRYMPSKPSQAGNPVLSVWQTDIVHYGFDLEDYLRHEFNLGERRKWPEKLPDVGFWDPARFW